MTLGGNMEIEIDNENSDEYYCEVMAAINNCEMLKYNPERKLHSPTVYPLIYAGISVAFILVFSFLYMADKTFTPYVYVLILFTITLILSVVYYVLTLRRIGKIYTNGRDKKLVIGDDYVEITIDGEISKLKMSEIRHILINRYSIVFLPKSASSKLMAVDKRYRKEVVDAISDKSLIVDNSKLYGDDD